MIAETFYVTGPKHLLQAFQAHVFETTGITWQDGQAKPLFYTDPSWLCFYEDGKLTNFDDPPPPDSPRAIYELPACWDNAVEALSALGLDHVPVSEAEALRYFAQKGGSATRDSDDQWHVYDSHVPNPNCETGFAWCDGQFDTYQEAARKAAELNAKEQD